MSKKYRRFTTDQLIEFIKRFKFTRSLKQVHVHHTWLPNHSQFNGNNHDALNWGMEDYHINTKNWSTIGQHLTLFPDGIWLLGRDLNRTPASILGWNTGSICIEMIGNFDKGNDRLVNPQDSAIYEFCEFLVEQKGLAMKFHRDNPYTSKTCPGSGIDRNEFFDKVANFTENKEASRSDKLKKIMGKVEVSFKDMLDPISGKAHWSNEFVNYLTEKRIVNGSLDSKGEYVFRPNDPITRGEVATIVAKAMESIEETLQREIKNFDGDLYDSKTD